MAERSWYLIITFIVVFAIGLGICAYLYLPQFTNTLSGDNSDWGNFGQFFFGLGTMVFTAISAFVMLGIDTQLNRSNIISKYETLLKSYRRIPKLKDKDSISTYHVDMQIFLSMLSLNNNFSCSVQNHAKELYKEVAKFNMVAFAKYIVDGNAGEGINGEVLKSKYIEIMGKLGALLIVLITNRVVRSKHSN